MGKQWDRIFKKEGKVYTKVHKDIPKIARLIKKRNAKKILDLGCGSGRNLVYLAKNSFAVYGVDISPEGIRIAKNWLKEEGLKANFKISDIYKKLPYPDNFFDALISIQTLHHAKIEEIRKLIKEIERILKSKSLIFITVSKKQTKNKIPKDKLWRMKFIAPRTFIPLTHDEKGLIHYWFNKQILRKEFKNFKIYDIWTDYTNHHYAFLGELKTKF